MVYNPFSRGGEKKSPLKYLLNHLKVNTLSIGVTELPDRCSLRDMNTQKCAAGWLHQG